MKRARAHDALLMLERAQTPGDALLLLARAQTADSVPQEPDSWGARINEWVHWLLGAFLAWVVYAFKSQPFVVIAALYAFFRAFGTTVETGQHGLLFSFGRARRVIPPGFKPLIPFLQIVVKVPTRSRTMDLGAQRVTTADGLVYFVDTNVVYRIVDVSKALIEIDDVEKGMRQLLGLSVQEVVRAKRWTSLRLTEALDEELRRTMQGPLEAWGVALESVGFISARPSPKTLRITQLERLTASRGRQLARLDATGMPRSLSLPLVGDGRRITNRTGLVRARVDVQRRRRRLRRAIDRLAKTHPKVLRASRVGLLRWLTRTTDSSRSHALSWAKKSLHSGRSSPRQRRPGDPRPRES